MILMDPLQLSIFCGLVLVQTPGSYICFLPLLGAAVQGCNGVTVVLCGQVALSELESMLVLTFPGQHGLFRCRPATSMITNPSKGLLSCQALSDSHCGVEPVSFLHDVPAVWYRTALGRRECSYIPNNVFPSLCWHRCCSAMSSLMS